MLSKEEKSYLDSVLHVIGTEFDSCDDCDNEDSEDVGVERDLIRDGETDDDDDEDDDDEDEDEEIFWVILDFFVDSPFEPFSFILEIVVSSHVTSFS